MNNTEGSLTLEAPAGRRPARVAMSLLPPLDIIVLLALLALAGIAA